MQNYIHHRMHNYIYLQLNLIFQSETHKYLVRIRSEGAPTLSKSAVQKMVKIAFDLDLNLNPKTIEVEYTSTPITYIDYETNIERQKRFKVNQYEGVFKRSYIENY